jgi:hypothetical protein
MRFRRLTIEELAPLEKEFAKFLAVCGIEAPEWEKMKTDDKEGVEQKIEEFSDTVIGSVLKTAKYIEHKSKNDIRVFKCNEDDMELMAMQSEEEDLLGDIDIDVFVEGDVKLFTAVKEYAIDREDEIFMLMQQGCVITDHVLFNTIKTFIGKNEEG